MGGIILLIIIIVVVCKVASDISTETRVMYKADKMIEQNRKETKKELHDKYGI